MKFKIFLFLASAVALASCVDIPDFSDTPKIGYNGISQYTQTDSTTGALQEAEIVTVTVNFEDGDGDLGLTSAQIQDPAYTQTYKKVPNWGLLANYELVTMIKQKDGSFREAILSGDSSKFFPDLKPDGKPGPIKGKLDLNIRFLKSRSAVPTTVKFRVRIMDRGYHISETFTGEPVITDEVIVPMLQ